MPNRKAGTKPAKAASTKTEKPVDLIEVSSDSQSDDEAPSPGGPAVKKQGKLAVRVKEHRRVNLEIPMSTPNGMSKSSRDADEEGDVFKTPMERRHITFDDSDQDEFVTPREAPLKNPLEEAAAKSNVEEEGEEDGEEEDSDDDEAPEAISTHAAEAQTTKAAKAAAKAAEQQAASQRKKRQERDNFFKQQAEEKKRAQELARAEEKESASAKEAGFEAPEKRKRQIPKLLPLELLESDDEEAVPQRSDLTESSKRRKLAASEGLVREPKAPKDQKVGSTVFRVVADRGDQKLAPKRKKQSVNLKEDMLRRDRIPQQKRGFFVK